MGFKEDADFARFVSMGAVAVAAVRDDLKRHGHQAIELERYAMANKVWRTKVKRMRLPDLVCVRCGQRFESRGKTQLAIVLSHSEAEDRAWDGGGMRAGDLYAFLHVDLATVPAHTGEPVYFRTADLRATVSRAKESSRKASSEGSEMTLTWASWVPNRSGTFVGLDSRNRLICDWKDGRRFSYWQWRDWSDRHLYLDPGDPIVANDTMVAGAVALPDHLACPNGWDVAGAMSDHDQAERYSAIKTAGVLGLTHLRGVLAGIVDHEPDWRIRLEAMASLARLDPAATGAIAEIALTDQAYDQHRIECVLLLSEIPSNEAAEALAEIAQPDHAKPNELRAAAVWGLAQGVHRRSDLVLPYTIDDEDFVALHAVAGLPEVSDEMLPILLKWLRRDDRSAAVAAQLLMRHARVDALLAAVREGGRGRLWALRALGDLPPELVKRCGEDLRKLGVEETLEAIWIGQDDWLRGSGAVGLEALDIQKIRYTPLL